MKILSIGNSFSEDAQRYLHRLAKSGGVDMKCVNLYIGGCSLKTHYYNMLEDSKAYAFQFDGEDTKIKVTIKEALMSDEWDYITLQQVSAQSPDYKTYQPYLNALTDYVRKYCPHSKILLHQTWAYEDGCSRLVETLRYPGAKDMFADIEKAYMVAKEEIGADGIIPCGEVFIKALEGGIGKIHRDCYHADLGIGRYALALTWYTYLTKNNPVGLPFDAFDVPVEAKEKEIIEKIVAGVCL